MIKKITIICLMAFGISTTYSQVVSDSAILGSSYANQVFYKLSDGSKTVASNTDWDLQLFPSLFSASIRVNSGNGVELYSVTSNDTANFASATLDTSSRTLLHDGYSSWEQDVFTSSSTGHPNYGWGNYQSDHSIKGNQVFAIKLSGGTFKKIWIKQFKTSGEAIFSIANLDGTSLVNKSISRTTYASKRHFYYDIDADAVLDLEPAKASWDIVFRKFNDLVAPGTYYKITGGLTNNNIGVAQVDGVHTGDAKANWSSYAFDSSAINIVGGDWKSVNSSFTGYDVTDSLSYFIKDNSGDVYQVIFTGATFGSQGGKMFFTKELISLVSIEENSPVANIRVYPNPTTSILNINFELVNTDNIAQLYLYDMNGRVVKMISNNFQNSGFNQLTTDISELQSGVLFFANKIRK